MTMFWLVAVVVLALLHELVAARRSTVYRWRWVRLVILGFLVASAGAFGESARLTDRVGSLIHAWRPLPLLPVPFEESGDPFGTRALVAQRPARAFPLNSSADAVEAWQRHVVGALRLRAELGSGPLGSVHVEVVRTDLLDDVRRTLIRFTSRDGTRIPAYVHEPAGDAGGRGGVLVVPGHGAGIRATAGLVPNDYQHAAALELARYGWVTLTPELRGFGMLTPDGVSRHRAVAAAALEAGSFYKAIVVRDLAAALTVLQQWRGVDPNRVAVAGASLGGELAVLLGAVDGRVRVVVSQSYGGNTGPSAMSGDVTDDARQTPHGCHTIPGVNHLLWQEDWFRLLAPRPVLFVRGTRNVSDGVESFATAVRQAFTSLGALERFEFLLEDGGHEFFVAPAVRFLEKWL